MRKNFTLEQMLHTVRQAKSGTLVAEVCCNQKITEQTLKWIRRVAGTGIAELTRLPQVEEENKKLKALVPDLPLDKHMLQEVLRKILKPVPKRAQAQFLCSSFQVRKEPVGC